MCQAGVVAKSRLVSMATYLLHSSTELSHKATSRWPKQLVTADTTELFTRVHSYKVIAERSLQAASHVCCSQAHDKGQRKKPTAQRSRR